LGEGYTRGGQVLGHETEVVTLTLTSRSPALLSEVDLGTTSN